MTKTNDELEMCRSTIRSLTAELEEARAERDAAELSRRATAREALDWKRADERSRSLALGYAQERDDERAARDQCIVAQDESEATRDAYIAKLQDELDSARATVDELRKQSPEEPTPSQDGLSSLRHGQQEAGNAAATACGSSVEVPYHLANCDHCRALYELLVRAYAEDRGDAYDAAAGQELLCDACGETACGLHGCKCKDVLCPHGRSNIRVEQHVVTVAYKANMSDAVDATQKELGAVLDLLREVYHITPALSDAICERIRRATGSR